MLILTRKKGECIVIGDAIRIQILNVQGGHIRIGIDAPNTIPVHREELLDAVGDAEDHVLPYVA